ncbi:hypothetical protein, partial [Streptomyces aurantiacus]|uniref:hypothetical protein n=1 Tax=Streptomyces aurantiacus TaxID=47760 RepID=UPI00193AB1A6
AAPAHRPRPLNGLLLGCARHLLASRGSGRWTRVPGVRGVPAAAARTASFCLFCPPGASHSRFPGRARSLGPT